MTSFDTLLRRIRQHHAIEHATIHLLAARYPTQRFSGLSDPAGFVLVGSVDQEHVRRAVGDALLRLQGGESELAIHPNCGTNLATAAVLVTMAALIGSAGQRNVLDRMTTTLFLVLWALLLAPSLGYRLQSYTTLLDVADRWVAEIRPLTVGSRPAFRVIFE